MASIAALVAAAVLLPWTVRNFAVHGRAVLVKDAFWYVFWQGNHLGASGTDKEPLPPELAGKLAWRAGGGRELEELLAEARREAVSVDGALRPEELAELRSIPTEIGRMDWFRPRILAVLRDQPGHYLEMCARRLLHTAWFDPTNPRSHVLAYRAPYLILAALALAGLLAGAAARPAGMSTAAAMFLGQLAVFVLVITSARFRLSLEALLALPAGLALERLAGRCLPGDGVPTGGCPASSDRADCRAKEDP